MACKESLLLHFNFFIGTIVYRNIKSAVFVPVIIYVRYFNFIDDIKAGSLIRNSSYKLV